MRVIVNVRVRLHGGPMLPHILTSFFCLFSSDLMSWNLWMRRAARRKCWRCSRRRNNASRWGKSTFFFYQIVHFLVTFCVVQSEIMSIFVAIAYLHLYTSFPFFVVQTVSKRRRPRRSKSTLSPLIPPSKSLPISGIKHFFFCPCSCSCILLYGHKTF